jgi:hypothetical protein
MLLNESDQAKERLRTGRLALRQQLEQKQYATRLKPLQDEAGQSERRHYSLQLDFDCELRGIKTELIDRAMAEKVDKNSVEGGQMILTTSSSDGK